MKCRIEGKILDAKTKKKMPGRITVRSGDVIATSAKGRLYAGNRFYADGSFWVECAPGRIEIEVSRGFAYVPARETFRAKEGKKTKKDFRLKKWFDAGSEGWFCGDNHWHLRHDDDSGAPGIENPPDWKFARLALRAEGLDYGTEQGSIIAQSSPPVFSAGETSPNQSDWAGKLKGQRSKLKTPIIRTEKEIKQTLGGHYAVMGGMKIATHPSGLIPAFHWLTAINVFFDAAAGVFPDAFDVFCYDRDIEQLMYFALLNSGAKIPGTASTDACLERKLSAPPGSKRVYTHSGELDYAKVSEGIKGGRNFVCDGPVFLIFKIDGFSPGDSIIPEPDRIYSAVMQVFALNRIVKMEIIRCGNTVKDFRPLLKQKNRGLEARYEFKEGSPAWYTARAFDEKGNCALSNPVYFESPLKKSAFRYSLMCCMGNFNADNRLGSEFNLHARCRAGNGIVKKAFLFKDGIPRQELPLSVSTGSRAVSGKFSPYLSSGPPERPCYFEVCYPLKNTGYYHIQAETSGGILTSRPILYDASSPNSHQISYLKFGDSGSNLEIAGWCEDIPLSDIGKKPGHICGFDRDRAFEVRANFSGVEHRIRKGTDLSSYFADF